jgi:hypothetical protein
MEVCQLLKYLWPFVRPRGLLGGTQSFNLPSLPSDYCELCVPLCASRTRKQSYIIMANFDSNHWQQINISPNSENTGQGQSMDGSVLYTKQGTGSVFFTDTNTTAAEQLWQIFAFNSSYYVLRTQGSGPEGYMNTGLGSGGLTPGNTVPLMANYLISDDSMFWKISPWGDGTFFFTNAANGTAWNLAIKPNSLMVMTSNISAPQDAQRFSFTQQGTIDDVRYSSVLVSCFSCQR